MHITQNLGVAGLEQVVVTLCRTVDRTRFDPSVLCLKFTGLLAETLRDRDIPVLQIEPSRGRADYLAWRKVARVLREQRIDVVHTHNTPALIDGVIGAKLAGTRTVVHTDHGRLYPDKRRYLLAEHILSHFVYKIAAVSAETAQHLRQYQRIAADKLVTITNGVESVRYESGIDRARKRRELGIPPTAPIVGFAARLAEQKGLAYLLEAFPRVRERVPAAHLVVAGHGPLADEHRSAAHALGITEHVHFLGLRTDVAELLQLFDCYVIPSVWEGLPMALLEAMAAGCPIVASNVGGVPMALRDGVNGSLVEPREPEQLAAAIVDLLGDEAKRRRFAAEGKAAFQERFSAEAMTRRYEALYERRVP
jgi:glycosyltransferase involved in cell wall biosynthesis